MKTNYGLFFMAFALIAAMLVWSINYEYSPKRKPVKTQITDWDAWYQDRMETLSHRYGGTIHYEPLTAEEFLDAVENKGERAYVERLPIDAYRKVMQHFLDKFPLVDLNSRLAYEDREGVRAKHSAKHKYQLSSTVNALHKRWNDNYYDHFHLPDGVVEVIPNEVSARRSERHRALEVLHRDRLEAFADQDSFGHVRMADIDVFDLTTSKSEPTPSIAEIASKAAQQGPSTQSLSDSERADLKSFPKEEYWDAFLGFGNDLAYVPDFRKARGYVPHALSRTWAPRSLQLKSLELVSLLKYDVPKVYISDRLPDMKLLANAETRDLDSFERSALERLFKGEFVVVDESPQHLQVLGALHAGTTCVECHAVEKGELLGAFSYKFDRTVEWSLTLNQ